MFTKKFKDTFKLCLNQISPKLYMEFLKTRYSVTNNMNMYLVADYQADGTFVTMWDKPPKYYKRWLSEQHFDSEGVPLHTPDGRNIASAVPVVQFGLCEYGYFLHTNIKEHLDNALRVADWLVKHQAENGGWLYEYDYYHPRVEETIRSPWICGMAQGEAVGFLARMYKYTGNAAYKDAAEKALEPLEVPVEQGGVRRFWNGLVFYEEYPTPTKPTMTINGFMFCLVGLSDYSRICGSEKAKKLFDEGYETLIRILPYYDSENTSYYDLSHLTNIPRAPHPAGKYDPLHVTLCQTLNCIRPNEVLRFYAEKWSWGIVKKSDMKVNDANEHEKD